MKGVKARGLIKQVARDMAISAEMVEAVFEFYWDEVRTRLISPNKEVRLHLANLGDFVIKPWSLKKEIERFEILVKVLSGRDRIHVDALNGAKNRLAMLQGMWATHEEELQRKKFINQHKQLKDHVTITPDLEE